MSLGRCPACRSEHIRYSADFFHNLWRWVKNAHTRHCLDCDHTWHIQHDPPIRVLRLLDYELIALAAAMAGTVALVNASLHPIRRIKTEVRAYYDGHYGQDSARMLWHDLGIFYQSKDSARSDYERHPKKPR